MTAERKDIPIAVNEKSPLTEQKILGVYPQKQKGLFMQRVGVFGGRITWAQWRKVAELAACYSAGFPVHITTRQDIELHNIFADDISAVHEGLASVGLSTLATGGDSLRNITVSTGCPICQECVDVMPVARTVRDELLTCDSIFGLPRKFKISFSECVHGGGRPYVNDLGFVGRTDGSFDVIGAGSLGANPALGIPLYSGLATGDILPLCTAAIEFFNKYGDRQNRRRARLRHVREQLGDEAFRTKLDAGFQSFKQKRVRPDIGLSLEDADIRLLCRLQLPNGNISPKTAVELADTAEPAAAELRINLEHGLELHGKQDFTLPENLLAFASNPIIVACPGSTTCTNGIANCWAMADKLRQSLKGQDSRGVRINISGCPNNCAQSAVADIGLVGMKRRREGELAECFRLLTYGGNGADERMAEASHVVDTEDVPATVARLVNRR